MTRRSFHLVGAALVAGLAAAVGLRQLARARTVQLFGRLVARVDTPDSVVALTFDDGPVPALADSLVAVLRARGVRATFFVIGRDLAAAPAAGRTLVAAGHELGNHTYSHRPMVLTSPAIVRREIEQTDALIRAAGARGAIYFRPPYGVKLVALPFYLWRTGRTSVTWDVEPDSYPEVAASPERIVAHVLARVRPGSIILLHPWYRARATSLAAVPLLVDSLLARGYRVTTVGDLLAGHARGYGTPLAYLDSALALMERRAYARQRVDWRAVRAEAHRRAAGATRPADTYGGIRYALAQLDDGHSHLIPRDTVFAILAAARHGPPEIPGARLAAGRVGYVALPAFATPDTALQRAYAERAQRVIARLDSPAVCGWVVDLRSDAGGSSYPMLAAVGPLLGPGAAGADVDADGQRTAWGYADGATWRGVDTVVRLPGPGYRLRRPDPPVAILTGPGTASAGEQVAIAFRGLARARTFGAATWGVPTSNGAYPLPDSTVLAITEARMADRTGSTYDGPLPPDEPVDADVPAANDAARARGAPTEAAARWVQAEPACARRTPNEALQLSGMQGRPAAALGSVAPRRRRALTARN